MWGDKKNEDGKRLEGKTAERHMHTFSVSVPFGAGKWFKWHRDMIRLENGMLTVSGGALNKKTTQLGSAPTNFPDNLGTRTFVEVRLLAAIVTPTHLP